MNHLMEFQKSRGLGADGSIGSKTAAVMMKELKINSIVEFAHFIAQTQHESANFYAGRENLNYSAEALKKLFGKYFRGVDISKYARNPVKIANRIYANRMGNGDEASGDGYKYRGTAALQLTGKGNITAYLTHCKLDLNSDPNILLLPEHYFNTAKWFFDRNKIWQYCKGTDGSSIITVSRAINLGDPHSIKTPIGLAERTKLTYKYLKLF
ncbi:MAG: glycoside hydrolase family 19 protein [Bacilli bacterium]|nr:glycoside hydrolase family 19 protein [Bacilli bacterium]